MKVRFVILAITILSSFLGNLSMAMEDGTSYDIKPKTSDLQLDDWTLTPRGYFKEAHFLQSYSCRGKKWYILYKKSGNLFSAHTEFIGVCSPEKASSVKSCGDDSEQETLACHNQALDDFNIKDQRHYPVSVSPKPNVTPSNTPPRLYDLKDYRPDNQTEFDHSEIRIKTVVCNHKRFHLAYEATWGYSKSETIQYMCPDKFDRESQACKDFYSDELVKCINKAITFYDTKQPLFQQRENPLSQTGEDQPTDIGSAQ